jgi:hypothetical protein
MGWVQVPGGSVLTNEPLSWRGSIAAATWESSLPLTWKDYGERLRTANALGYQVAAVESSHAIFRRSTGGDVYTLSIEVVSPGPPLRARYQFTAMPD